MGFRSFRIAFALGLIAGSGVSISACSSDDEEPQGKAGTGAGATGGAGGSSGRGGSAGTGAGGSSGTGATGGAGGTGGMGSITCGTRTCQPGGLGFIPACCIDNERCGIDPPQLTLDGGDLPCTEVGQPGTPDPTCFAGQGIDLEDSGIDAAGIVDGGRLTIPGCCRPNGMCGIIIDVPQIGLNLGCIDPEGYGAIYDAGPPQRCGDAGGGNDGGGNDASIDSGTGDSSTDDSSTGDSTAD